MLLDKGFFSIKRIRIAHEYVLDRVHRCAYPSGRGHFGIVYALSGEAEYRFSTGERIKITKGSVILLSPDAAYTLITKGEFAHYTVNFDINEDETEVEEKDLHYYLLATNGNGEIRRIFKELVSTWSSKRTGYEMRATGYLYEIFSVFLRELEDGGEGSDRRLSEVRQYIEKHFDEQITLERLASVADMSVSSFRRLWRHSFNESPIEYRDSVRIFYAKEFLASGYYSISEVAKKCGIEDVSYFVRFFKKACAVTPGEYRKGYLGRG